MSFKKILAVVAVTGLVTAMALPAMALENEFHGMFRLRGFVSNFDNGNGGTGASSLADGAKTTNYYEQRARLMYSAKASDDLKLVTHFEIDSRWGDSSYNQGRNTGGALGADQINLETKSVYLDFNVPAVPVNVKAGMQPFIDSYKGIFVNADAAGALAAAKFTSATVSLGYFRFDDVRSVSNTAPTFYAGKGTRDLYVLDAKLNVSADLKLGASYYLLDGTESAQVNNLISSAAIGLNGANTKLHTAGVNAEAKIGTDVVVDAFLLGQIGELRKGQQVLAYAGQAAAKVKAGPGTARVAFLYASGEQSKNANDDTSAFQPVRNATSASSSENSFYPAEMLILLRNKAATSGTDKAILYNISNLIGGFVGYDLTIDKFFASANAGFAALDKDQIGLESNYLGTEVNAEVGYKLYENLSASLQGGYMILGDAFKVKGAADPKFDNPYTSRVVLSYTF